MVKVETVTFSRDNGPRCIFLDSFLTLFTSTRVPFDHSRL